MAFPQAVGPAKGGKPALGRNARAGEDDDVTDGWHGGVISQQRQGPLLGGKRTGSFWTVKVE